MSHDEIKALAERVLEYSVYVSADQMRKVQLALAREVLRLQEEAAYLRHRLVCSGSAANDGPIRCEYPVRCTGVSSDAMVEHALGGYEPTTAHYPYDIGDLEACERAYKLAPAHLRAAMKPTLKLYREHIRRKEGR